MDSTISGVYLLCLPIGFFSTGAFAFGFALAGALAVVFGFCFTSSFWHVWTVHGVWHCLHAPIVLPPFCTHDHAWWLPAFAI
jgi:hypothetical protein